LAFNRGIKEGVDMTEKEKLAEDIKTVEEFFHKKEVPIDMDAYVSWGHIKKVLEEKGLI
jgi:hypothetical protein